MFLKSLSNFVIYFVCALSFRETISGSLSQTGDNNFKAAEGTTDEQVQAPSYRQGRCLIPLVVVRFQGDTCFSQTLGLYGNCISSKDCQRRKGNFGGLCAIALGVCCVFKTSCGGAVNNNNTYFQSRNYPGEFQPKDLEICTVDIWRNSDNICQAKIDFLSTRIEGGDSNGICKTDSVIISGSPGSYGTIPPNLCGPLSNQSVYIDFAQSRRLGISVITSGIISNMTRSWNIKVTYISCDLAAPTGCLQYYTGAAGQVKILGYPQTPHLGDLGYSVCIRAERGARSITWSRCVEEPEDISFWFTGAPVSKGINAFRRCNGDYVLILSTISNSEITDRYCGNSLSSASAQAGIHSFEKPFLLRVRSDASESLIEKGNTGFCLQWRQNF